MGYFSNPNVIGGKNLKSVSTDPKITGKETILVVDDEAGPRESHADDPEAPL